MSRAHSLKQSLTQDSKKETEATAQVGPLKSVVQYHRLLQKKQLINMGKEKNGILQDVILVRFVVVILLLFCLSFTIYGNGWRLPEGWLLWFAIAATTISSYIFAHYFLKTQIGYKLFG